MTDETLLLIGRDGTEAKRVYETHAERLRARNVAESVRTATYEHEPRRDVRETVASIESARTYAVPLCLAHTNETTEAIPAAFGAMDGDVRYCEPVGQSPEMTRAILDRAGGDHAGDDTTLVLVGFGNTTGSYQRQAVEYHADRIREAADFADVTACYLLQNPTVECVRYNISTPKAVAVPLFVAPSVATTTEIPDKLDIGRAALSYTSPLSTHESVTDAIQDRVETRRAIADTSHLTSYEDVLAGSTRPMATDGEGR